MATAAEIESYHGNSNEAFGGGLLPAGSNAEVLDFSPATKSWMQYAQNKYAYDKAQIDDLNKQRLANAAKVQELLGKDKYEVWNQDNKEFDAIWNDLSKQVVANPSSVIDPNDPLYRDTWEKVNKAREFAKFSMQQKADWDKAEEFSRVHPEILSDEDRKQIADYRGMKVYDRAQTPLHFEPQVSANFLSLATQLKGAISPQEIPTYSKNQLGQNVENKDLVYSYDRVAAGLNTMLRTDKKQQAAIQDVFNNLSQEERTQYKTAENFAATAITDLLNGGNKTEAKNPYYPPAYEYKAQHTKDVIGQRKELIYRIQNKDAQALNIFKGLQYQGYPIKNVEYTTDPSEKEKLITQRDELQADANTETDKKKKADLLNQVSDLQKTINKTPDEEMPTVIRITTQRGKKIDIEVSEDTGGGFQALNQFINDLQGQEKISVEELSTIPEYSPKSSAAKSKTSSSSNILSLSELKKTIDFGTMTDAEIQKFYEGKGYTIEQ